MPIETAWYGADETIGVWSFKGKWDWEELYRTVEESVVLAEAVGHRIDTIYDFTESDLNMLNILTRFKSPRIKEARNHGILVSVGNGFVRAMTFAYRRTIKNGERRYLWAATIDQAAALIYADRAKQIGEV